MNLRTLVIIFTAFISPITYAQITPKVKTKDIIFDCSYAYNVTTAKDCYQLGVKNLPCEINTSNSEKDCDYGQEVKKVITKTNLEYDVFKAKPSIKKGKHNAKDPDGNEDGIYRYWHCSLKSSVCKTGSESMNCPSGYKKFSMTGYHTQSFIPPRYICIQKDNVKENISVDYEPTSVIAH